MQRIRWLPVFVTVALLTLIYLQANQMIERPVPTPFWIATLGSLFLLLAISSVRAWYIRPPIAKPRKFVTWVMGYAPPPGMAYYTAETDHLTLKAYFSPANTVDCLGVTESPVFKTIAARWGQLNISRDSRFRPQPGDTIMVFHVIAPQLDPTPTDEQLEQAVIVPLLHTVAHTK